MNISIVICTYNRCDNLRNTLDTILIQEYDGNFEYEVIVVDNNSNDNTKDIVLEYVQRFAGKVRYLFEPKQGKSYALNYGVKEAKGEIINFTDDDCVVDKNWIMQTFLAFATYNADCVFGKILPIWLERDKRLWGCLGLLDYGKEKKIAVSIKEQFFGANFAIKKTCLNEIGNFDSRLGLVGRLHLLGEDTDIFLKLLKLKKKIVYVPLVVVHHKIQDERLKMKYFKKWYTDGGRSFPRQYPTEGRKLFNVPFWFIKEFFQINFKFMCHVLSGDRRERLRFYFKSIYYFNALFSYLTLKENAKS